MKKVLFATDFSDNANQAFEYLIHLANQLNVEIVVIHVVNLYPKADMMMSVEKRMMEDNQKVLDQMLDRVRPRLSNPAAITGKIVKGDIVERLKKIAEQLEVDLIVAGTKGERNPEDFYLGRTAGSLIKETDTALLLVPAQTDFVPIKDIVFAIKSPRIAGASIVEPLLSMQSTFGAQLHLLKVNTGEAGQDVVQAEALHLGGVSFQTSERNGEGITQPTLAFLEEQPANLLCGIRRQRGFFQRLLTRNGVKKSTFNLTIPFLILRGVEG